jgi:hypothetical protein
MPKTRFIFFTLLFVIACFLLPTGFASAYVVENLNIQPQGNIVVGPGRTELFLSPGDQYSQEVIVTNASGVKKMINISVEDMEGTNNADTPFNFLGEQTGPYSVKDYVKPEVDQVLLDPGQRLRLQAEISIPQNAEPGDLDGAIMVAASNVDQTNQSVANGNAGAGLKVITRVASLLFITVKGDALQNGSLDSFTTSHNFYENGPVSFEIIAKNGGNVHLTPSGAISIKNVFGQEVGQKDIEPFFTLPKSTKTREIAWNSNFLIGRYTAALSLSRGYSDIVDTMSYSFWVIPWKIISIALIILILIVLFLVWIFSHIEWKKKPSSPVPARRGNGV